MPSPLPTPEVPYAAEWVAPALRVYLVAFLGLTALAACFTLYWGLVEHRPYPYNWPLFYPQARFGDLTTYDDKCSDFQESGVFRGGESPLWIYPAPSAYLQCFILNDTPQPEFFLAAASLACALGSALLLWWKTPRTRLTLYVILATCCLSYPFAYGIDRGNLEPLIEGLVVLFIIFFIRKQYWAAALFLVLATCIKPYPAIFFAMLVIRRRYAEALCGAAAALGLNYLALAGMGTSVAAAYAGIQTGLGEFMTGYAGAIDRMNTRFDHSIFSAVKQTVQAFAWPRPVRPEQLLALCRPYLAVAASIAAFALVRLWRMPAINQFLAFSIMTVTLPWVSYDYTLVELYPPFGLFLIHLLKDVPHAPLTRRQAIWILLLCSFIFTPQSYLILGFANGLGGALKSLALAILLGVTLLVPLPSSLLGERAAQ